MEKLPTILQVALGVVVILFTMNVVNEYNDTLNRMKIYKSDAEDAREAAEQAKSEAENARDDIQDNLDDARIRRLLNN
jgi:cell division protein ZapA (FtsZ GTPase activity inhibitor)